MSLREFAAHLGVSDRMVSKWEAKGEAIHPRPVNQAALDTSLATSTADERARFEVFLDSAVRTDGAGHEAAGQIRPSQETLIRHSADDKDMTLVAACDFLSGADREPDWLPAFYIDVFSTTNSDYGRFVSATGHRAPPHWVDGKYPDDLHNHPVVFVTWHDADAYARWAQKRLPTAKQWEKAARAAVATSIRGGTRRLPPSATLARAESAT